MATPSTKERILSTTARLFRRQGFSGTGLNQVLAEASAPFGSLYYHFPGSKAELGAKAVRFSGEGYIHLIDRAFGGAPDPFAGMERFFAEIAKVLRKSKFAEGCPIATVSTEVAGVQPELHEACGDVFRSWREAVARHLEGWVPDDRCLPLATFALAAFEGAVVLAQAERDLSILDTTAAVTVATVRAEATAPTTAKPATRAKAARSATKKARPGATG